MRSTAEDAPRRYVVVDSDPYDSDRDTQYLHLNRTLGPVHAGRWLDDLELAINDLTEFPGPLSHARDEDAADFYGREVRRMFYYGPTRKRIGTLVRVLFTVHPPVGDEPPETAEWVLFLLRLLGGGQALAPEEEPA